MDSLWLHIIPARPGIVNELRKSGIVRETGEVT